MPVLPRKHILQGVSGKLGSIVLRQLNGKTIIQAAPVRKAPATPAELANREMFKKAVAYAKQARHNPELWDIYVAEAKRRGGNSNAFAVAVSDYRKGLPLAGASGVTSHRAAFNPTGNQLPARALKEKVNTSEPAGKWNAGLSPEIWLDMGKMVFKNIACYLSSQCTRNFSLLAAKAAPDAFFYG